MAAAMMREAIPPHDKVNLDYDKVQYNASTAARSNVPFKASQLRSSQGLVLQAAHSKTSSSSPNRDLARIKSRSRSLSKAELLRIVALRCLMNGAATTSTSVDCGKLSSATQDGDDELCFCPVKSYWSDDEDDSEEDEEAATVDDSLQGQSSADDSTATTLSQSSRPEVGDCEKLPQQSQ